MRLEQLLVTNGYTKEDLIIVSLPTADQISVIISSASLLGETERICEGRKISSSSIDKKVSFDCGNPIQEEDSKVESSFSIQNQDVDSSNNNVEHNDVK